MFTQSHAVCDNKIRVRNSDCFQSTAARVQLPYITDGKKSLSLS